MSVRVLIAESRAARQETLRAALTADPEIEVVGQARDGQEMCQKSAWLSPDIVILAADLAGWDGLEGDGFEAAERLSALTPAPDAILLSEQPAEDLRRAMRAGARECLRFPPDAAELRGAVRQVWEDRQRRLSPQFAAADLRGRAKLVAVSGAKGGIGKTTLAVNLAAALAVQTGEPTALLDLYTQFGDAALLLNITPRRTLAHLAAGDLAEMDERLLEDHLETHECGLRLLAGASAPLPPDALSPAALERILSLAGRLHRFVVLDVPPLLTETTRIALAQAEAVLLVANLFDLTTLADSRLWLEAVAGREAAREAVHVVLNRVSPRNRLSAAEIERTLGFSVFRQIPNDGRIVPASVNAGVPFVLSHPVSRVAGSVLELARALALPLPDAGLAAPHPVAAPPRAAFFAPLLRRGGRG